MNTIGHKSKLSINEKSFLPFCKICPCPKMCGTNIRLKFSEKVKFGTNDRNFCSVTKL